MDGVSLTVADLTGTTFGQLKGGEPVNVETDVIGKYLQRSLALRGAS